ncbi:hypothetical protein [Fodinicurvata halophila]|uniref:hypothetical protein n=1 Tax=Fodinicurvata halophila TaxID=1419723 RepID=UPI00362D89D0
MERGYEAALGAALGDDLEAPLIGESDPEEARRRLSSGRRCPTTTPPPTCLKAARPCRTTLAARRRSPAVSPRPAWWTVWSKPAACSPGWRRASAWSRTTAICGAGMATRRGPRPPRPAPSVWPSATA